MCNVIEVTYCQQSLHPSKAVTVFSKSSTAVSKLLPQVAFEFNQKSIVKHDKSKVFAFTTEVLNVEWGCRNRDELSLSYSCTCE